MANVTHGGRSQMASPSVKGLGLTEEFLSAMTVKELTALADKWDVNPRETGSRRRVLKADFIQALVGK